MPASSDPFFKETIYQRTCKFWTLRDYKKNIQILLVTVVFGDETISI